MRGAMSITGTQDEELEVLKEDPRRCIWRQKKRRVE